MGPEPATSKSSRGSRYRSNEAQANSHSKAGDSSMERGGSQRSETGKSKSDKDGTESGRGVKRRQHGGGGVGDGGGQGGTSGSMPSTQRSSKRWRGDSLETLDISIPTDRWDGGTLDSPKEKSISTGKSKHDSEGRSGGEAISAKGVNLQSFREGGDRDRDLEKASRKQRVSKASLVSDSRAITVMDLQDTDGSIIASNIRIKNKVSYRRESTTSEVGDPELLEKGVEENAKNAVESSRSRRRWDKDGRKGGAEAAEEGHSRERGNVGGEGSQERERKKVKSSVRDRDREKDREREREKNRDRDVGARLQNGRRSAEGSPDLAGEVDGILDVSDELDTSNDFKIQEELRNVELEKELENRIRRRREESGDRDRWRDDDRERDGKRHSHSRERDERSRDERERQRSRRDRERHSDRYESRQHREGSKMSEGRQREEKYYESDREYRSQREERHHGTRSKDLEEQGRDWNRDQDYRDRKGRDSSTGHEAERRPRDKGPKDDHSDRERSYPTAAYGESLDGARGEHRNKRVRESDGEVYGAEREHSRQRGRPGESDTILGNESGHEGRHRRNRDEREGEGWHEGFRGSPRDNDGTRGKGKSSNWRKDGTPSEMGGDGVSTSRHDARGSPSSNRIDYVSSPHLDDNRSPRYYSQGSPSHLDRSSGASRGKTSHGDWFEPSNSVSNSSGLQRRSQGPGLHTPDRRDRSRWNSGSEEEVKGGMFRGHRATDEGRESPLSPHRLNEQHHSATQSKPPLHGQDSFPRGMGNRAMMEARSDRGGWRGAPSGFDGVSLDHHGLDDLSPRERNDRGRRMPMNRPPGSPMVRSQGPQMSSLPAPPLAPLPPPPPFRPGIDNPAVLGPMSGGFDEGAGSREQGRGERKGGPHRRGDQGGMGPGDGWRGLNMGGWNSRNQGPLPGNGFGPFPPQFGHSPAGGGGFPGMVQQFPGPPMFPGGGGRLPMDMGFGGGRFMGPGGHMGEGGDGYLGPGRGTGWHGPGEVDDGRGPPLMGPGDGWEGPGPHGDDRLRHGRMDWDRVAPMGVRGWERDRERDIWEARRDGAPEFMPHRSQMDPHPQNPVFASPGGGWGMPRDSQVPNELKLRQDREPFDIQEAKRKPDGGPPKPKKPSRPVSTSEGRLAKYGTSTMQSVLSQLEISPDLAGPELYAQYRALLPPSPSGKQNTQEKEDSFSEPEDEDLTMEADPEGEAFITGPNLLAKLLPPLPDDVFQEALRLYRKPETQNRVQKSSRGSFVLPFDSSTIKVPSISMRLDRYNTGKAKEGPHNWEGGLRDQLEGNVIYSEFPEELGKPNDETQSALEKRQGPLELEGVQMEDMGREIMRDEFMSSHVEVAEYSDREFEAEIEDILEEDSSKDMPVCEVLFETSNPADEEKDSLDNKNVYKVSLGLVDSRGHANDALTEAANNGQGTDAPKTVSPMLEMKDPVYNICAGVDQVDSLVVEADQVATVVLETDQLNEVVVEARQGVTAVLETDQVDKVVVEADQVDKMIVEGDQVDMVVEGDEADKVLVEAYHDDKVVVEVYHADNLVEDGDQVGIVVEVADQEKNVVEEADLLKDVIDEVGQVDNEVDEVNVVDNVVTEVNEVDTMVPEADLVEDVNRLILPEGAVNDDSVAEPEKSVVVDQELKTLVQETSDLKLIQSSHSLKGEYVIPQVVQFPVGVYEEFYEEFSGAVPASKEVIEEAEGISEEPQKTEQGTGVEHKIQDAPVAVESNDPSKYVDKFDSPEPLDGEGKALDKQGSLETAAVESIESQQPEESLTAVIEDDARTENNGKLKEIVENSLAPEQPAVEELQPEPLTRLRKRRASNRLLAQQSAEAQVVPLQESSDRLASQESVVVKKARSRGSTRTSQRKSKRRGSTH